MTSLHDARRLLFIVWLMLKICVCYCESICHMTFSLFSFPVFLLLSSGWVQFKCKENRTRDLWHYCKARWQLSRCRNCGDPAKNGRGLQRCHLWEENSCGLRWGLIRKLPSIPGIYARFGQRAVRNRKVKQCCNRAFKRWVWHRCCSIGSFKLPVQAWLLIIRTLRISIELRIRNWRNNPSMKFSIFWWHWRQAPSMRKEKMTWWKVEIWIYLNIMIQVCVNHK